MIRKLDRYVLRELAVPTISSTLLVALLFAGNQLIAAYQTFNVNNIPPETMLKLVILSLPGWLKLTLPVGVAMGCSLAISRLTREGELTAIRSAGVPIWRSLAMVWLAGIAAGFLTFYIGEEIAPKTQKEFERVGIEAGVVSGFADLESNLALKINQYSVFLGSVSKLDEGKYLLQDVLVYRRINVGESMTFVADSGAYQNGIWSFPNGITRHFEGDSLTSVKSDSLTLNQANVLPQVTGSAGIENKTRKELWEQVKNAKVQGALQGARQAEVHFYVRYSVPASCLVFALASSYLAIRFSRASAFQGLMFSLIMALAYYNLHMICLTIIGPNGWMSPVYAAWLPVGVFGLAAILLGSRLE